MNEAEKVAIYEALEKSVVTVKTVKHDMLKSDTYYTDINYYFGDYRVVFTQYTPASKITPMGHVCIFGKNNKPLCSWNQTRTKDKYIYDIYMAVKNKYEGKAFKNAAKIEPNNPNNFGKILSENAELIFPKDTPEYKRLETIAILETMFLKRIDEERSK